MTDRELLELAAKAAGISIDSDDNGKPVRGEWFRGHRRIEYEWNPLTNDGDALRLAVMLMLNILPYSLFIDAPTVEVSANTGAVVDPFAVETLDGRDPYAATRRAIVRAAATIGKEMK